MKAVFADTHYWLALLNPRDQAHQEALTLSQSLSEPVVTTAWVLTEVGDAMCDPANRLGFVQLAQDIASDPHATLVGADQALFERGLSLYSARPDKKWSLTDCISFVVMKDLGLTDPLTGDGDFVQAGFHKLMA